MHSPQCKESVLVRMRIGHTYLTHWFLLQKEEPPRCIAYDFRLTVKHILFDCVNFIDSRNRHCNVNSFKELFGRVPYLIYMRLVGCTVFEIF